MKTVHIYADSLAYVVINQIFMPEHQQQVDSTSNKTCPPRKSKPNAPNESNTRAASQPLMNNHRPQKAKGLGAR